MQGWPQTQSERLAEYKISCPCRDSNTGSSSLLRSYYTDYAVRPRYVRHCLLKLNGNIVGYMLK